MQTEVLRSFHSPADNDGFSRAGDWVRQKSGTLIGIGVIMVIVGAIALMNTFAATMATVWVLGVYLLIGGIMHVVDIFTVRRWNLALLEVLAAVLYLVAAFYCFRAPLAAAATVTIVVATLFMVGGAFRFIGALALQPSNWGWMLAHGVITFLLGLLLFTGLPFTGLMGPGLLVGVDLLFSGISAMTLGFAARRALKRGGTTEPRGGRLTPAPT